MKKKDQIRGPWDDFFEDLFGQFTLFIAAATLLVFSLPLIGLGIGIGYWIWG